MGKEVFTGERFIPGIDDKKLETEHMQRYLSFRNFVKDKNVLDAACGEGYGSRILAEKAKSVIGLDISKETVERANQSYATECTNLSYQCGSIANMQMIESDSIDVVVSFETIEHVDEETQKVFMKEIKRVLKPDGILIMSTPNKRIYSDLYNYHNEFHVKEFYQEEFLSFISDNFKNMNVFSQSFEVACIIDDMKREKSFLNVYNTCRAEEAKYIIAVASDAELPDADCTAVTVCNPGEYDYIMHRVVELQDDVEERNGHLKELDDEIDRDRKLIVELKESNDTIVQLKETIEKDQKIIAELKENNDTIAQLKETIEKDQEIIAELNKNHPGVLELEEKNKIYQQTIRNKEGHIELLLEKEREYENFKTSRTYRLAMKFKKIACFLCPPNSKRRFFGGIIAKLIRNPRLMLKVISIKRIKHYFLFLRTEGMEGVWRHYKDIEDLERARIYDPNGVGKYDISNQLEKKKNIEEYEPIIFDEYEKPTVSIIIPVYNQFEYTYNCLESIRKNTENVSYEILIANDCSTDATVDMEKVISGVRVITTEKNERFLRNCNNAAKYAKGEYIFFLNNDTQVQKGWLESLVSMMEKDSSIGMSGSKLVYADGRLQEAGGIVWKDASAWNYGNRGDADGPEYSYVKEVDYISGAAILIRKKLWEEIGGFDERFAPAYYEDTDLAFEVRKHGYKVVYNPASVVIHFEGISNGTDTSEGQKAYQVVNHDKFYEKWKDVLEKDHFENGQNVFLAKDRSRYKNQILVVDHYVPHYDKDAGGKCTYMYLLLFLKLGMKVTFIGDNFYKHEPYTTDLNQKGIEVLYGNYYYNNWQQWLKDNLHYFDYIYLQRPHISIKYIDLVKQYGRGKIFYFAHDLHHIREYREYLITGDKEKLKSSEKWKKIEMELFSKTDVGHVVGSYEQEIMQKQFPDKPIRNIPLYIYEKLPENINTDFSTRKDLIYVGGFGHAPNIDAVLWFAKEVMPQIVKKYPDIKWHVVGSNPPEDVKKLASDNIIIEGFVSDEDLEKLYRTCRMAVVPLRYGAGVKGKVVEAGYYQIPLVTTTIGAEGISTEEGSMKVEDDPQKMADLINGLYEDYDELKKMSESGKNFIENHFTLERAKQIIEMDL